MKEINIDEIKQIQLDIVVKIDEICRKNGIEYFLDVGTGIGAARHKGYIPWDDDIDISMTRSNYERLILIGHKQKVRFWRTRLAVIHAGE